LINVNVACDIKSSFKMSNTPPPTEVENGSILKEREGEWAILNTGLTKEDKLTYALESLRKSFDCKLNTLIQTQKASDLNYDDKMTIMIQTQKAFDLNFDDKMNTLIQTQKASDRNFDDKMNTLIQTQKASDQNFDNKINTLNQHLVDLKKDIQEENKQKTLERALSLTDLESFYYYVLQEGQIDSADLARNAIGWFMLDYGCSLPNASLVETNREATCEETKAFRDKFKAQIKVLIKREPRLVKNPNGGFGIHYS